jgi:hypothetical protein
VLSVHLNTGYSSSFKKESKHKRKNDQTKW